MGFGLTVLVSQVRVIRGEISGLKAWLTSPRHPAIPGQERRWKNLEKTPPHTQDWSRTTEKGKLMGEPEADSSIQAEGRHSLEKEEPGGGAAAWGNNAYHPSFESGSEEAPSGLLASRIEDYFSSCRGLLSPDYFFSQYTKYLLLRAKLLDLNHRFEALGPPVISRHILAPHNSL